MTTACIDIDNDGQDEILLGSDDGRLYIYKFDKTKNNLNFINSILISKIGGIIRSIEAIDTNEYSKNLIFTGTTNGDLVAFYFNQNKIIKPIIYKKLQLDFPIWSILPIIIKNKLKIIIGGEKYLSLLDIYSLEQLKLKLTSFKYRGEKFEERIYDITLLKSYPDYFRIICGTRSGKPILFDIFENNIAIPNDYPSFINDWEGRSSYSIILYDLDNDNNPEIIVAGKSEEGVGCIGVYKFNDSIYWDIYSNTKYPEEIYSIMPYEENGNKYLIMAMFRYPFVKIKPIPRGRIENDIIRLGMDIYKRQGEYVFFLGAGFSHPVFKLANEVKNLIMSDLNINKEELEQFLKESEKFKKYSFDQEDLMERLPLEILLYYIKNQINIDAMRDIIIENYNKEKIKRFNKGAIILSELIKNGIVNIVFTVNYDTLLETALEDECICRIIKDNDYKSTNVCGKKAIIKLHGCVTSPESIEAAIDEVLELKHIKRKFLDFIFNGHKIIFVGYSCRDKDLLPVLKKIIKTHNTECYFIDPNDPQKNVRELIALSDGDLSARYFQITSNEFFELIKEGINRR